MTEGYITSIVRHSGKGKLLFTRDCFKMLAISCLTLVEMPGLTKFVNTY